MFGTFGFLFASSVTPDPYYSNVSLLMHMDGTDGGTVFTDQKGKTVTAYGTANTAATSKYFGTAGLSLGGSTSYVSVPGGADFNFGTGDWTIEMRAKTATSPLALFGSSDPSETLSTLSVFGFINTNGTLRVGYYSGGTGHTVDSTQSINDNAWHHIDAVRSASGMTVYIDGVGTAAGADSSAANSSIYPFSIGSIGDFPTYRFVGSIDEVRVTKGVARYTANFTVPYAAYPNS